MEERALRWAIKESLVAYVRDLGGAIEVTTPARERDGEFVFPADSDGFAGSVRLSSDPCRTHPETMAKVNTASTNPMAPVRNNTRFRIFDRRFLLTGCGPLMEDRTGLVHTSTVRRAQQGKMFERVVYLTRLSSSTVDVLTSGACKHLGHPSQGTAARLGDI